MLCEIYLSIYPICTLIHIYLQLFCSYLSIYLIWTLLQIYLQLFCSYLSIYLSIQFVPLYTYISHSFVHIYLSIFDYRKQKLIHLLHTTITRALEHAIITASQRSHLLLTTLQFQPTSPLCRPTTAKPPTHPDTIHFSNISHLAQDFFPRAIWAGVIITIFSLEKCRGWRKRGKRCKYPPASLI